MNGIQIKHKMEKHRKKAKKASRKCCYPNCSEKAISSHLLQKNGILTRLTDATNHLFQMGINPFKSPPFQFEPIGYNDALTFPGFCSRHDNQLFNHIEGNIIHYNDYKTQLLFSYRAVMNEMRKKEYIHDFYASISEDNEIMDNVPGDFIYAIMESMMGLEHGIDDERFYASQLLNNLDNETDEDFIFHTIYIPRVDVCACGVFTYETTEELMQSTSQDIFKPLTEIYFNLLPEKKHSIIIIGCHKEKLPICKDYLFSFAQQDKKQVLKLVSNVLINQLENWLCSKKFFNQNITGREQQIMEYSMNATNGRVKNERIDIPLNLFEK